MSSRFTVFEACSFFKEIGFDGVEICFEDINFNLRPDLLDDRIIALIREHCENLGLTISAVGNHLRYFFNDFNYAHIQKEIRTAKKYGTDVFILSAMNDPTEKVACKELRDIAAARIKTFCKVAESEGVVLALEPEPPSIFANTQDYLRLCEEVNSPALCINFDVGHAFLADVDVLRSIELVRNKIRHCHIEDMQRGQHLHLLPGDGDMDIPRVLQKLREVEFDGYMSLDLYNYTYEDVAKNALETLRKMDGACV
ncbi:MAG: sugar phosphate isomerase/epimerase family protein [Acetanaerobacterium sp.]